MNPIPPPPLLRAYWTDDLWIYVNNVLKQKIKGSFKTLLNFTFHKLPDTELKTLEYVSLFKVDIMAES